MLIVFSFITYSYVAALSQDTTASVTHDLKFDPKITGCIRAKFEQNTSDGFNRFEVRNARYQVYGDLNNYFSYKAEIDLMDEDQMKMLDAFVNFHFIKNLEFKIGQQKVPISTDFLRAPNQLDFSNRSFVAKRMVNDLRDVGLVVDYLHPFDLPFNVYLGVFNGAGSNTLENDRTKNACIRVEYEPVKNLIFEVNGYKGKISSNYVDLYNLGFNWKLGHFFFDSEFTQRNTEDSVKTSKATSFFVYGLYYIDIKNSIIKTLTPGIRYDEYSITKSTIDEPRRLTAGLTFSFAKITFADIRLNYEKYWYKDQRRSLEDKFTTEFIVRF